MRVAGVELRDARPVAGGDICRAVAAATPDGVRVFAKTLADAPAGFFAGEARGLDALRAAGGPPVPAVVAVGDDGLVLEWVEPAAPTAEAAWGFGAALARLHRVTAVGYGADATCYVGTLAVAAGRSDRWADFFAEQRLLPALQTARRRGSMSAADIATVEEVAADLAALAGPAEPPARVHGDLWQGNLLWAADGRVWLVDAAAAHDGNREIDLAMLALFGAPLLEQIRAGYDSEYPLPAGWQDRLALHQLHPLLVHAALFGGGYGARAGAAARAALG